MADTRTGDWWTETEGLGITELVHREHNHGLWRWWNIPSRKHHMWGIGEKQCKETSVDFYIFFFTFIYLKEEWKGGMNFREARPGGFHEDSVR